jgi:RHS repeat-associated protein
VDLNGSNQFLVRRMYLASIDNAFARVDSNGNAAWYLTDHLASTRELINAANTSTDVISYDAFGSVAVETNSAFGDRYKYTGRETDSESGLQYNRTRSYSPTVGRWTTCDTLSFGSGDTNLYRYVTNSPLDRIDPQGEAAAAAPNLLAVSATFGMGKHGAFAWGINWKLAKIPHPAGTVIQYTSEVHLME